MDVKAIISDCTTAVIFASFYESTQLSRIDSKSHGDSNTFRVAAFARYAAIFAAILIGCRSMFERLPGDRARTITEGLFLGVLWCLMTIRVIRRWRRRVTKS